MHKVKNDDVLSLDSRRRIYDCIRKNPGAHLREVARSLDLPLGTALYHLDYLSQNELIVVRRDGRYKRFFVKHMLGRLEKDYVSAFHHAVPRRIALVLLARGKRTQRELCEEVGVSRSTLSFHVNNLVEKGILKCDELWPENYYSVADPEVASKVLVMYRETFREGIQGKFEDLMNIIKETVAARGELGAPGAGPAMDEAAAIGPGAEAKVPALGE